MPDTWNSSDKFNREALQWDENPQRRALALVVAQAIVAATKPGRTMSALEFGCGTGLVSLEIAPLVKRLLALDTSREMLAVLQEKIRTSGNTNIETACIDLSSPSEAVVEEKSFDLIYSSMTLHHIDNTAEFLKRISTFLCPGALVALADLELEDGLFHDDPLENVHHGFDRAELAAQLKEAGLRVISFETIYTFDKINRSGVSASYPVFLVTAEKEKLGVGG